MQRKRMFPLLLLAWLAWSSAAVGQNIPAGLSFLEQAQRSDGSWGDPQTTGFRDTTVVVDTLKVLAQMGIDYSQGIALVNDASARSSDSLARQVVSVAGAGLDVSSRANVLLSAQDAEIASAAQPNFPGRGWGLSADFATDALDTALALRALQAGGFSGGVSVVRETVAASTSSPAHPFTFPAGASNLLVAVREATGPLRLLMHSPSSGTFFVDLTPADIPVRVGPFPTSAGQWSVQVQNLGAAAVTYTLEVGFTRADGFDVFRLTTPLVYLGLAQNGDGGWGIAVGEDSTVMITTEVLRTLEALGSAFAPTAALDAGVAWLIANHQNGDGGFGSAPGVSTTYETALCALAIGGLDSNAAALPPAVAFLTSHQEPNGSWDNDPYATALALQVVAQAVVTGAVTLQGRAAPPNVQWTVPLTVTFTPTGQVNPTFEFTPTTDQNGIFTVLGIAPGTYDVRAKGNHTLRNTRTVTLAFGSNDVNLGTLREGDADNNNFITLTDFSILVTTFGKCEGSAGYDARADFNQSGCVTLQDFSLLATNFGQAGNP